MSGLSLVRATAPDVLVNSLKFDLPDTASYIKERSNTTFWPLGGNVYSPTQGTRLIRFVLSDGTGFLDPSSVVLTCSLVNTSAAANRALRFRGPPITMAHPGPGRGHADRRHPGSGAARAAPAVVRHA